MLGSWQWALGHESDVLEHWLQNAKQLFPLHVRCPSLVRSSHPHLEAEGLHVYSQVPRLFQALFGQSEVAVCARHYLLPGLVERMLGVALRCLPEVPATIMGLLQYGPIWQDLEGLSLDELLGLLPEHFRRQDGIHYGIGQDALATLMAGGVDVLGAGSLGPHCLEKLFHDVLQPRASVSLAIHQAPELDAERGAMDLDGSTPQRLFQSAIPAKVVAHGLVSLAAQGPESIRSARVQDHQPLVVQLLPGGRCLARHSIHTRVPIPEIHGKEGPELIRTHILQLVRHDARKAITRQGILRIKVDITGSVAHGGRVERGGPWASGPGRHSGCLRPA
mmetsp:Transcript_62841/g.141992  ORF Transcript_62841/g.141992 Transcript_62841/m.141992 type:complete len:334 (-) Transcript_62841:12-1013(-)